MKKKCCLALAASAAIGAWGISRDRKYPLRPELRFANKMAVPGFVLEAGTAKLANRALALAGAMPTALPVGIEGRGTQIPSEDGTLIRLTIYRPEALDWAAPCLVYFHGGGFYLGDAGYIHRYVSQYSEGAQCSNAPDTAYAQLLQSYQRTLSSFAGPTELLVSGNTLQLNDYSKTDWPWSVFDPEAKKLRHETVFPKECAKVRDMGAALVAKGL